MRESLICYKQTKKTEKKRVDKRFCPHWSRNCPVPKRHTEAYINYKIFGLLGQTYY